MKKLVTIMLCIALCFSLVSCKSTNSNNVEDNSSSTASTSQQDSNSNSKKYNADEIKKIVEDFYGSTYVVNDNGTKDNIQSYKIIDKKGNPYSNVTVDLEKQIMSETVIEDGENNQYNLTIPAILSFQDSSHN